MLCQTIRSSPVTMVESDVVRCFSRVNPKQNTWAQWIASSSYKKLQDNSCVSLSVGCWEENHIRPNNTDQLGPFFTRLFQLFLDTHSLRMETIYHYADCQKKSTPGNLMTSAKWRLQLSLLNVRKDLYVINILSMWSIARIPTVCIQNQERSR